MFRNRNDELQDLITLFQHLKSPCDLLQNPKTTEQDIQTVRDFIQRQIESFSTVIIESMMEYKLMDYQFIDILFNFDRELFEKIFKNAIEKWYQEIGFNNILIIVRGVKYFLQAVVGYEAIYKMISADSNHSKESYELSKRLQKMCSMSTFTSISHDQKCRITNMIKDLPLYAEDLRETSRLLITNLGNACHLNLEMTEDKCGSYPVLAFGTNRESWTVHHDMAEKVFEFETNEGLVLCTRMPPSHGDLNRDIPAQIIFEKRDKATLPKWKIEYYKEGDPSKGYIIKAAKHDVYLCGNRSAIVHVENKIDLEDSPRFTWKFQCIESS